MKKSEFLLNSMQKFTNIPEYKFKNLSNVLPYQIDNSTYSFFPPMKSQIAYSCHQFSSVYFTFTYEINRLRNSSAAFQENQMSELFTYNFSNLGNVNWGVPYPDSWNAIKTCGNASVADFTNDTITVYANGLTWMSGYEKYLRGLNNKIEDVFSINTQDIDGLEKMKQWLFNHDENSEFGGLLNCMLGVPMTFDTIPEDSHFSGELLYQNLGPYVSHAVCIVGYNDSICFDFNNDGLYTNNLDINGDGSIDVKDYERGAFKVAETFGESYGNNGFLWLPYRHFATPLSSGGIWNYSAHLITVKEQYQPQLSVKINLTHEARNAIRVRCGFANDTTALLPEKIYDYPVFCFQGGDNYMTGGIEQSNKSIEIGIDISQILSEINPQEPLKFFLEVTEKDVYNQFSGTINEFTVINHLNDSTIFSTGIIEQEILNNTSTLLSLVGTVDFDKFRIIDSVIFTETSTSYFEQQIFVENGSPPYKWNIPASFSISEHALLPPESEYFDCTPSDGINGIREINLDFDFPYFDSIYSKVYVSVNGFIFFEDGLRVWPYLGNSPTFLKNYRLIAPFFDNLRLFEGDSLWYTKNDTSITINWKTSKHLVDADSINVKFSVCLRKSGDVFFSYQNIDFKNFHWISGCSSGNEKDFILLNDLLQNPEGKCYKIECKSHYSRFNIDNNGVLSFNPMIVRSGDSVKIMCEDNNDTWNVKTIKIIQDEITENSLSFFPNPFVDEIYFYLSLEYNNRVLINIYDLEGKEIASLFSKYLTSGYHIIEKNLGHLNSGLYFLNIYIGNKEITHKIIKI